MSAARWTHLFAADLRRKKIAINQPSLLPSFINNNLSFITQPLRQHLRCRSMLLCRVIHWLIQCDLFNKWLLYSKQTNMLELYSFSLCTHFSIYCVLTERWLNKKEPIAFFCCLISFGPARLLSSFCHRFSNRNTHVLLSGGTDNICHCAKRSHEKLKTLAEGWAILLKGGRSWGLSHPAKVPLIRYYFQWNATCTDVV